MMPMKTNLLLIALALTLAACGVKNDPVPPSSGQTQQAQ